MSPSTTTPLGLLLTSCLVLVTSVGARFFLRANFTTYNNTLHAYWDPQSDNGSCCDGMEFPTNCTDPCKTSLRYCFKNYETYNDISNDGNISSDCIESTGSMRISGILTNDYIDYSIPGVSPSSLTLRGKSWPGQIQFFVRSAVLGGNVIDYFVLNFPLEIGETLDNQTIYGTFLGSDVTFTVSFSVICVSNSTGPDCSCQPANSSERGHYTCLSDGSRQCLPGYQNNTTDCTECIPTEGCHPVYGFCNAPGECECLLGYGGDGCQQDMDVCGHTHPCQRSETCTNTGPDNHTCTPSTESESESSVVPLAVGVAGGSVVLLILLAVLVVLALVALKRRMHAQTVDFKGDGRDDKSGNGSAYRQESELGLMSNPVYEVGQQGTHLPLGRSPSAEEDPEHDLENPLYMMGVQGPENTIPIHDYDYAMPSDAAQPTSFSSKAPLPPTPGVGQVYAEPDIGHSLTEPPPQHTYDYAELGTGTPKESAAGPVYDAPILPEQKGAPIDINNHYETAENTIGSSQPPLSTIYDSDSEDLPK